MYEVEQDIQKVSDAYETLVKHSQKREHLNKSMRIKLETELKKLSETNRELKGQNYLSKLWNKYICKLCKV